MRMGPKKFMKELLISNVRRSIDIIKHHREIAIILIIAAAVRIYVFNMAILDITKSGFPWLGSGTYSFFGFTINIQFEGYTDYDFYYVKWVDAFLKGTIPYSSGMDKLWYFYPPMYIYVITLGKLILPTQFWSIGMVLATFDFLIAIPVYGIAQNIFNNKKYALIAASCVLFNPINLYYSTYLWLNTPVFVFFWFMGFYFMTKERYGIAAVFIGLSAMSKQIAFFLVLPLIASAIKKDNDKIDVFRFLKTMIILAAVVLIISTPYIFINVEYISDIISKASGFIYTDITKLPNYSVPIQFEVPFIALGAPPDITIILAILVGTNFLLLITILNSFFFMLIIKKDEMLDPIYYRKLLFITMIMFIFVHLFSPRGCYKYYWVALVPFWALFNFPTSLDMAKSNVPGAIIGFIKVISFSLLIMIPSRYFYLLGGLLIAVTYIIEYILKNRKMGYYVVEFC